MFMIRLKFKGYRYIRDFPRQVAKIKGLENFIVWHRLNTFTDRYKDKIDK